MSFSKVVRNLLQLYNGSIRLRCRSPWYAELPIVKLSTVKPVPTLLLPFLLALFSPIASRLFLGSATSAGCAENPSTLNQSGGRESAQEYSDRDFCGGRSDSP